MHGVASSEYAAIATQRSDTGLTRALLRCGILAGPLFIIVGMIQVLTRPGFDVRYNVLSQMALGDLGWIQVANFVTSGLLVIACAIGMRHVIRSGPAATWGSRLIAVYGVSLIGAAIFGADPGFGFPPGAPAGPPSTMSTHGLLHFACAGVGFFALIAACIIFARRYAKLGQRVRAAYSAATGVFFLVAFVGTASGAGLVAFTLALWVAIALAWVWLSALAADLTGLIPSGDA
ncbi:MAG TPA: DUF998 domain-containing protein [Thermoanaerobaculia bacterium]|jgi:hypothetical protein